MRMNLDSQQLEAVQTEYKNVLVIAGAGSGKCQPNTTIIPTPMGYKTIGDIKIGDLVFDKNGEPETVIGVFPQGRKEVYRITLADGRYSDCCEEHLWSYDNGHNGLTTNTTKQMYDRGWVTKDKRNHNKYKYFIPNLIKPVEYKMNIEYSVNPYVLGCFIGDGCCLENALTISSSDEFIVKTIAEICDFEYKKLHPENYSWSFKKDGKPIQTKNFFNNFKKEICCCGEKRIPSEYFIGSISQRLELLRGLMDTDGYVGDGRHSPTYSTTSYGLAQDVAELSRSLGFFTSVLKYTRDSKKSTEYTVIIYIGAKQVQNIFKLPRKIEAAKKFENHENRMKRNFVSIRNIEKLDKNEEMSCILVDHPEHLYLTNNFIVTHNTTVLTERIKYLLETGVPSSEIAAITFTNIAAEEMNNRLPREFDGYIGTIHSLATKVIDENKVSHTTWQHAREKFNELLKVGAKYVAGRYKYVLVDELQDISDHEHNFIKAIKAESYFFVGDDWQCQPKGTKILLKNGEYINIEDIKVGDMVAGSNISDNSRITSCGKYAKGYKITNVNSRFYEKDFLYTIKAEKLQSSYTSNHIHYVRIKENEYNNIVYIMRNEKNQFRVGTTQLYSSQKHGMFGLRQRLRQESCIDAWIIGVYKTKKEALIQEQIISIKYQIPQLIFDEQKTFFDKKDLDYIYSQIDSYSSAKKCLFDNNKNILYPFLSLNDKKHFARNATVEIYACNIIKEIMNIIIYDENNIDKKRIVPIDELIINYINDKIEVFSLEVDKVHNYIADGILTHNCIYQFKGANHDIFFNLIQDGNFKKYYLLYNYRSNKKIARFGFDIISNVKTKCDKYMTTAVVNDGKIYSTNIERALGIVKKDGNYKDWFIISRLNQEVDDIIATLKKNGIPCVGFKKSQLDLEQIKGFMSDNVVKVLTIHSAKGLESKNVIVYQANRNSGDEELRVAYVAATRAKENLYWCDRIVPQKGTYSERYLNTRKGV